MLPPQQASVRLGTVGVGAYHSNSSSSSFSASRIGGTGTAVAQQEVPLSMRSSGYAPGLATATSLSASTAQHMRNTRAEIEATVANIAQHVSRLAVSGTIAQGSASAFASTSSTTSSGNGNNGSNGNVASMGTPSVATASGGWSADASVSLWQSGQMLQLPPPSRVPPPQRAATSATGGAGGAGGAASSTGTAGYTSYSVTSAPGPASATPGGGISGAYTHAAASAGAGAGVSGRGALVSRRRSSSVIALTFPAATAYSAGSPGGLPSLSRPSLLA